MGCSYIPSVVEELIILVSFDYFLFPKSCSVSSTPLANANANQRRQPAFGDSAVGYLAQARRHVKNPQHQYDHARYALVVFIDLKENRDS